MPQNGAQSSGVSSAFLKLSGKPCERCSPISYGLRPQVKRPQVELSYKGKEARPSIQLDGSPSALLSILPDDQKHRATSLPRMPPKLRTWLLQLRFQRSSFNFCAASGRRGKENANTKNAKTTSRNYRIPSQVTKDVFLLYPVWSFT